MYDEMVSKGILLFNFKNPDQRAATIQMHRKYAIFIDAESIATTAEEACIVAHELGHCETGTTHAVYSPLDLVEKHEYAANKKAVHRLIPYADMLDAIRSGCTEVWMLADQFNVTEDFICLADYIYRCEGFNFNIM